mmetsp:Transcript_4089/g.8827  ORF Transcript_4089/g.8827 Transcript_4089/m.8827 type:complete len:265 (-) Transcript_4089:894-1688(-)
MKVFCTVFIYIRSAGHFTVFVFVAPDPFIEAPLIFILILNKIRIIVIVIICFEFVIIVICIIIMTGIIIEFVIRIIIFAIDIQNLSLEILFSGLTISVVVFKCFLKKGIPVFLVSKDLSSGHFTRLEMGQETDRTFIDPIRSFVKREGRHINIYKLMSFDVVKRWHYLEYDSSDFFQKFNLQFWHAFFIKIGFSNLANLSKCRISVDNFCDVRFKATCPGAESCGSMQKSRPEVAPSIARLNKLLNPKDVRPEHRVRDCELKDP